MSEKKVVARTTAIALAILCVVILIGAVGAVIYYNQTLSDQNTLYTNLQSQNSAYANDHSHSNADWESMKSELTNAQNQLSTANSQSTVSQLQGQIDSLQSQLNSANSQVQAKQSEIDTANSQLQTKQTQLDNANAINNLQKSTTWVSSATVNQDRGSYFAYTEAATYAGYVSVNIQSSTTSNQYVQVTWSSHGVSYDKQITIGTSGTAVFPILPSSNIQIRIGNTNLLNGATATVTITYTY